MSTDPAETFRQEARELLEELERGLLERLGRLRLGRSMPASFCSRSASCISAIVA